MQFQIFITQRCNLHCCYCMQKYKNYYSNMTKDIALQTCDFIWDKYLNNRNDDESLSISLIGGEPLLEYRIIKLIVKSINKKNEKYKYKIQFELSTNGLLLNKEKIKYFEKYKIKMYFSIDGKKDSHNKNRLFPNGDKSYDKAYLKIKRASEKIVSHTCNMVVAPNNVSEMYENYIFIVKKFEKSRVTINFAFEQAWDSNSLVLLEREFNKIMVYYLSIKLIGNINFNLNVIDEQVYRTLSIRDCNTHNCGAGNSVLSIDTDGSILACGLFHYISKNTKQFILGNVYDGIDEELRNKFREKYLIEYSKRKCLKCNLDGRCYNYCPAVNKLCTGEIGSISNIGCLINKIIIKETENYIAKYLDNNEKSFANIYLKKKSQVL